MNSSTSATTLVNTSTRNASLTNTSVMNASDTLFGSFESEIRAARCIKKLCELNIPVQDMSVRGVRTRRMRRVTSQYLRTYLQGKYIPLVGSIGAVIGAVVTSIFVFTGPSVGLIRDLDLLSWVVLGSITGCMFGTLAGAMIGSFACDSAAISEEELPGNRILIGVRLKQLRPKEVSTGDSPEKFLESVRGIMEGCGATAVALPLNKELIPHLIATQIDH